MCIASHAFLLCFSPSRHSYWLHAANLLYCIVMYYIVSIRSGYRHLVCLSPHYVFCTTHTLLKWDLLYSIFVNQLGFIPVMCSPTVFHQAWDAMQCIPLHYTANRNLLYICEPIWCRPAFFSSLFFGEGIEHATSQIHNYSSSLINDWFQLTHIK